MKDVSTALSEWLASEQTFVERVTSRLPATPPNFARIVELNEAGELPDGDLTDLEAGEPLRRVLRGQPQTRV